METHIQGRGAALVTPDEIRALRHSMGLTQQQFADKLGLHKISVAKIEAGMMKPGRQTLIIIGLLTQQR